ncbi:MAG: hypothetical protein ACI4EF_09870 [Coprococcus sp.]
MKYKSTNELDSIFLNDAQIKDFEISETNDVLTIAVEGAVIKADNSQNEFYTDKYTDQMQIRFIKPVIEAVLLEGHKYYDANGKLIEQVPDIVIEESEYMRIIRLFKESCIFYAGTPKEKLVENYVSLKTQGITDDMKCYQMIIDVEEDSYVVSFYYEKAIAEWEHFLNKANIE